MSIAINMPQIDDDEFEISWRELMLIYTGYTLSRSMNLMIQETRGPMGPEIGWNLSRYREGSMSKQSSVVPGPTQGRIFVHTRRITMRYEVDI